MDLEIFYSVAQIIQTPSALRDSKTMLITDTSKTDFGNFMHG